MSGKGFVMTALVISAPAAAQAQETALGLEASVAAALKNSPLGRAALAAREAARSEAEKERPVARPIANLVASGTLQGPSLDFPRPNGTDATVIPNSYGQIGLIVEQILYRAGRSAATERYASLLALAELDYRKAVAEIALTARKAWLDVLRAESGLKVANDGLQAAERYLMLVRAQIRQGVAKPIDEQSASGGVAEAQAGVTEAEGGLALAKLAFNRALGRPLQTPVALEAPTALPTVPESPDAAAALALRSRVELQMLEQNLRGAKAGVALARTQTSPTLSLKGQALQQTPTGFVRESYFAATLELRWPLGDGGKARLDARSAQAQADRLTALREDARQGVALDVAQAWRKMRTARDKRLTALERTRSAAAALEVAEKAYELGRATVFEAQAAQREMRAAHEREAQALYDLYAAAIDFRSAQGEPDAAGGPVAR